MSQIALPDDVREALREAQEEMEQSPLPPGGGFVVCGALVLILIGLAMLSYHYWG